MYVSEVKLRPENVTTPDVNASAQKYDNVAQRNKRCTLTSAALTAGQFWMLIDISPLHSEKVIRALHDFLVSGYTRREVCEKYNVSLSYFSISLRRVTHVNYVVSSLAPYYGNNSSRMLASLKKTK